MGVGDRVRQELVGAEVEEDEGVLFVAGVVGGVGEQVLVDARLEDAEAEVVFALGQDVGVEQDDFRGLAAAGDRVGEALFGARVVLPVAAADGHGSIGLLDAAEDLLIELLLEGGGGGEGGFGAGVLGFEVGEDVRVGFFAEPEVGVDAAVAVLFVDHRGGRHASS